LSPEADPGTHLAPGDTGAKRLLMRLQPWRAGALALAAAGTLLGLGTLWAAIRWLHERGPVDDSWLPMLKALEVLGGPEAGALYETLFFGQQAKFQYAPTSLLPLELIGLVMPLSVANLNALNACILFLNAVAFAWLAHAVFAPSGPVTASGMPGPGIDRRWLTLAAFAAPWVFYPVTRAFVLGQIQLWIDLAFTLACLLWWMGRRTAAGFAIGLACAIKPQFGLFLVWALAWRRWDFAGGFLCATLPIAGLSIARYGWHNHFAYLDVLAFISRHGESFYANSSVNGIANRLLFNGPNLDFSGQAFAPYHPYVFAATALAGAFFMTLPLLLAVARRVRHATILDFGMAGLCFTMSAPVAWEHHYAIMLPLYVLALRFVLLDGSASFRRSALLLLALSWFLSAGRFPRAVMALVSDTYLNVLQSHLFFGAAILLGLLFAVTLRREAGRDVTAQPTLSVAH